MTDFGLNGVLVDTFPTCVCICSTLSHLTSLHDGWCLLDELVTSLSCSNSSGELSCLQNQ